MSINSTLPQATLHQLALSPANWHSALANITQLWQSNDILLLLAEAAQGYLDPRLNHFSNIAVLQTDADLLAIPDSHPSLSILSYEQWAELTQQYARTITWR